jgi:hypothetical protein
MSASAVLAGDSVYDPLDFRSPTINPHEEPSLKTLATTYYIGLTSPRNLHLQMSCLMGLIEAKTTQLHPERTPKLRLRTAFFAWENAGEGHMKPREFAWCKELIGFKSFKG